MTIKLAMVIPRNKHIKCMKALEVTLDKSICWKHERNANDNKVIWIILQQAGKKISCKITPFRSSHTTKLHQALLKARPVEQKNETY